MSGAAIITGASRGLGAEFARELAGRGYSLMVTGRDADALDLMARQLGSRDVIRHVGDVIDASDRAQLVEEALDRWGRIDVLVNNAAVAYVASSSRVDPAELESTIATNLTAPLLLIRSVAPTMLAARSGRILNVASTFGLAGAPYLAAYAATKAAVRSLGWSLNAELRGSGVRVTTAIPGPIRGGTMLDRLDAEPGGPLPWMPSVTATRAARQAVRAMERGRPEVVIARGGRAGVASRRLSQGATRLLGVTRALEAHAAHRVTPTNHERGVG